jgi:hypothetical protein
MASFIVFREIRFRLHNRAGAFAPNELRPNELARARDRIPAKKRRANDSVLHGPAIMREH